MFYDANAESLFAQPIYRSVMQKSLAIYQVDHDVAVVLWSCAVVMLNELGACGLGPKAAPSTVPYTEFNNFSREV